MKNKKQPSNLIMVNGCFTTSNNKISSAHQALKKEFHELQNKNMMDK